MPSRKMRTAIYLFYGLDVEIRPKWTLPGSAPIHPSCLSTRGGAIGIQTLVVQQVAIFLGSLCTCMSCMCAAVQLQRTRVIDKVCNGAEGS